MGVVTRNRYARSDYKGFPSDVIDTWTPADWEKFCAPCLKHPARYCCIPNRNCHYSLFPSSGDSTDSNGAGLNQSEEPRTAAMAGWGGPNGPTLSRLIYSNCDKTSDSSLKRWGLL